MISPLLNTSSKIQINNRHSVRKMPLWLLYSVNVSFSDSYHEFPFQKEIKKVERDMKVDIKDM